MSNKPSSLAKPQGAIQASRPSRATRWPDGTPRSQGNDFTAHLDGRPSVFASAQDQALATRSASSTAAVERSRAKGIEPGRLNNLSHHAEEAKRNRSHNNPRMRLPEWIGPNKPHNRRWAAIAPLAPTEQPIDDDQEAPAS
jgi:hypothetical protein